MGCYLSLDTQMAISIETKSGNLYFVEDGDLRHSQVFSIEPHSYIIFLSAYSKGKYFKISKKLAVKLNKLLTTV